MLWSLRKLGKITILRRFVKWAFACYFKHGKLIKIGRGPLKGLKWHCHREQQFWMPLGVYETETTAWLQEFIYDGAVFFDIGANFGYFSLLGGRLVGRGRCIAFEPISENGEIIRQHLASNELTNITLEETALSDRTGRAKFVLEENNANSHLAEYEITHGESSKESTVEVKTVRLDEYCRRNGVFPDVIKLDVEGAEVLVLSGAKHVLTTARPTLIISTHSESLREEVIQILEECRYDVTQLPKFDHELSCIPIT